MAVADFFRQAVPGAGPSTLAAMAPLALGMLGPVGGAVGVLGALYQKNRQEQAGLAEYGKELASVGPGGIAEAPLSGLVALSARMAERGMKPPDILQDRIDQLQAEQEAATAYQRSIALQQLQDQAAAQRLERGGEIDEARVRLQAQLDAGRDATALEREKELARYKAEIEGGGSGGVKLGAVGTGMARVRGPDGSVRDVPIPGSPEYAARVKPIVETKRGLDLVQGMLREIDETGGDMFGARAKRQDILFNQVVSVLGSLANAGVLQAGEAQRFLDSVGDPTSLGSRFKTKASMKSAYQELERQLLNAQGEQYGILQGEIAPPIVGYDEQATQAAKPPAGFRPVTR